MIGSADICNLPHLAGTAEFNVLIAPFPARLTVDNVSASTTVIRSNTARISIHPPHDSSRLQLKSGVSPIATAASLDCQSNPHCVPSVTSKMAIFTPATMALQSIVYICVWLTTTLLVRRYGPSTAVAPIFIKYHNRFYSFMSFLLLLLILSPYPQHDAPARNLYHLSKFYEYMDILSVTAVGGAIDLHFGFHHLTTPWLTFVRVLPPGCERWRWFGAANAAHHVLIYAYFGGWQRVRNVLLWTGQVQLAVGMLADAWAVGKRLANGEGVHKVWRFLVSGGLLAVYWVLNSREMRARAREEGRKGTKGKAA